LNNMRILIQRVNKAEVSIKKKIKSKIGSGLLILLGIEDNDNDEDIFYLVRKLVNLRIFNDEDGIMNISVKDTNGEIMVVSQFTLHASTKKGNRPSYIRASKPDYAIPLYKQFVNRLEKELGKKVKTGEFGAMMQITLTNDGPVTIFMDSKNKGIILSLTRLKGQNCTFAMKKHTMIFLSLSGLLTLLLLSRSQCQFQRWVP
jgi:D-tyrosyl-tRNA(Tyr) deacylase